SAPRGKQARGKRFVTSRRSAASTCGGCPGHRTTTEHPPDKQQEVRRKKCTDVSPKLRLGFWKDVRRAPECSPNHTELTVQTSPGQLGAERNCYTGCRVHGTRAFWSRPLRVAVRGLGEKASWQEAAAPLS